MNKNVYFTILLLLTINSSVVADAFPKSPESLGGPILSLEFLGSYELEFSEKNSVLFWGGYATICSPLYLDINGGPEAAVEIRQYFSPKENKIWSISLYTGVAYNFISEQYGAFTPGLKLTRKKSINQLIQLEPYISLSYPFYFEGGHPYLPFFTFGYRIVFEKKRNK